MTDYKRKSAKRRMNGKQFKGGAGAADFAISTYGNMNQQHAGPEGNVIAANSAAVEQLAKLSGGDPFKDSSAAGLVPPIQGGKKRKGGNMITELAVPAVLLVANHVYKRKGANTLRVNRRSRLSRKNVSRRVRGGNAALMHKGGNATSKHA